MVNPVTVSSRQEGPLSINQRPSMDVATLAGRVPYEKGLYVVGPFAERVSFASQQRRALSLVWAIDEELRLGGDPSGLKDKNICIVGAGLAGLTCSVAAAAFEANSWLLEAEDKPLKRMMEATHRDIHPSINFWPREIVTITTELPFMNWYQDRCDRVLARIYGAWLQFDADRPQIRGITLNCRVTGLRYDGQNWQVDVTGEAPRQATFDIVILALGFGTENFVKGSRTPAYWDKPMDRVEAVRTATTPVVPNHVVSGTGDGGLIEVLRLLYKGFQAGKIAAGTSPLLTDATLQRALKAIESDVRFRISDDILHDAFPLTDNKRDVLAQMIWDRYDRLYDLLPQSFLEAMRGMRTAIPKVTLLGVRKAPTEHGAAPYHRLLIMQAIRDGSLEYHQISGQPKIRSSRSQATRFAEAEARGIQRKTVAFDSLGAFRGAGGGVAVTAKAERVVLDDCFFLSRHGTTSPLQSILQSRRRRIDFVRKRQSLYGDQDWISMEQASLLAERLEIPRPDNRADWMRFNLDEARQFFEDRYGLMIADESVASNDIHRYILMTPRADRRWTLPEEMEILPKSFYGVPVDRTNIVRVRQFSRSGH